MKFKVSTALLLLAAACLAWNVRGGDGCGSCPHCGGCLTPVCKLVPVVTKTPKTEYYCKCGDICVPGRSTCVGTECVTDCDGCTHNQKVYEPCCGKVYATVTPGKKTTIVEKCSYKCVVEYQCCKCGCCGNSAGTSGYSAGSYAPSGPIVHPHEEPHPLHKQSN
jgi:hypothetical protein